MKVAIFGGGQIGRAVEHLVAHLAKVKYHDMSTVLYDNRVTNTPRSINLDLNVTPYEDVVRMLETEGATHVINAMPFFMNEKVAQVAIGANCHYIDFTEDDQMAARVQRLYAHRSDLVCAVKCGLAPGFINYLGHSLVGEIDKPESLTIAVGALPRNVNGTEPWESYNLSWSVDGLVNEYIRPCQVRSRGVEKEIAPLTGVEKVIADGVEYEMAFTSGGIGSLVKELKHVPNVAYKTLRYPGHYAYVTDAVKRNGGDFDKLKAEFLQMFPYTNDDVIVVYAEAKGRMNDGAYARRTFSNRYLGFGDLTAIQTTTAGAGVAVLEMMLTGTVRSGAVNHADVSLNAFSSTYMYQIAYGDAR